ncbi:MAG: hypothetical protein Q8N30_11385 [Methylococcales bacterium]|nr:hypothetical protein [Methylococcales bacterium]
MTEVIAIYQRVSFPVDGRLATMSRSSGSWLGSVIYLDESGFEKETLLDYSDAKIAVTFDPIAFLLTTII